MYKQIANFMDKFFSKCRCNLRKGYNTEQYLICFNRGMKKAVDKGKAIRYVTG